MTSQYRHRRSSNPSTPFPANIEPGEIAVNTANRQISVGDAASATLGVPKPLLAIRIFDSAAIYAIGDIVMQAGVMYRAVVANGPGAFNAANWGLAAAQIVVSDTPPANPSSGSLWWESDSGLLYIYYVDPSGPPGQWVIASPQPDFSIYAPTTYVDAQDALRVAKTGDTMTGNLTVAKDTPRVVLDKSTYSEAAFWGFYNGVPRWKIAAGTVEEAETGGNTGNNFIIAGRNDDGSARWTSLTINRASGLATVFGDPTAALGVATKQYVDAGDVAGLAASGMQINGSMEVSQENGNTSRTTSGFVCDGWLFFRAGTMVLNVGQTPTAMLPGISSQLYLSVATPQASLAASDQAVIYQNIEGYRIARLAWGTPNAQPITIGFWSQCSKPGVYSVAVCNSPVAYTYATTYTHAVANVSQYNVITIPGPTVGTWKTDNTAGLVILFAMAAGSAVMAPSANAWITGTYNAAPGQVNGVAGVDIFRITGVIVLPGTQAPTAAQSPLLMRPYDQELLTCKRYYHKIGGVVAGDVIFGGYGAANTTTFSNIMLGPAMRVAPTVATSGTWANVNVTSIAFYASTNSIGVGLLQTGAGQVQYNTTVGASLVADARL